MTLASYTATGRNDFPHHSAPGAKERIFDPAAIDTYWRLPESDQRDRRSSRFTVAGRSFSNATLLCNRCEPVGLNADASSGIIVS